MIVTVRTPAAALLAALALTVAGCGDDDTTGSGGGSEPTGSPSPAATETGPVTACGLVDETDVEAAYGEDVPPGTVGGGGHDDDGLQWQSDNCGFEVEDGLDVTLAVLVAEDYPDGELVCPELDTFGTPGTPVPELGDGAAWVTDEVDPNEGTLRVCGEELNFDIDVESPDGSRDPETLRAQTLALAEVVLSNLGQP